MLRAALLDMGGTLWPDRWPATAWSLAAGQRLRDQFGLSPVQVERLLREFELRDPGLSSPPLLAQDSGATTGAALRAAGLSRLLPGDVLQAMDVPSAGLIQPFAGAETLLRIMKSFGLRVVIVSNAFFRSAAGYRRDFEQMGIGNLVDEILSSVDTGVRKPHPRMFRLALASAGSFADDTLMIGDSEAKDIVPAKLLGMRAIRVAIEKPEPQHSEADAIVTALSDIADIVADWCGEGVC